MAISGTGIARNAAMGSWAGRRPSAAHQDPRARRRPMSPRGAVCPGTDQAFNEEPDGGEKEVVVMVRVIDQQLDKALRLLKRQLARDGTWRELKARAFYEKPSVKKRRRQRAVRRRLLKLEKMSAE
jgi:small subunit ribosomal protein S21